MDEYFENLISPTRKKVRDTGFDSMSTWMHKVFLKVSFHFLDAPDRLFAEAPTYHLLVLSQNQVIVTEGHTEDDCCHSFKTVNPLLSL